jgi:hypothetical protein
MHTWMAVMVILLLTGVLAADVVAGSVRGYSPSRWHLRPATSTDPSGWPPVTPLSFPWI